jgi:hypothetical protein
MLQADIQRSSLSCNGIVRETPIYALLFFWLLLLILIRPLSFVPCYCYFLSQDSATFIA